MCLMQLFVLRPRPGPAASWASEPPPGGHPGGSGGAEPHNAHWAEGPGPYKPIKKKEPRLGIKALDPY